MPAPINDIIKKRVVQQWLGGEARDKIASDLQIGAGTVSNIVSDFKNHLQGSDIDSIRELAAEARKQKFTLNDLAAHMRLHNFFDKSGASEERVESFITNVSSNDISPERIIELVYQLHEISKTELIPLDKIPSYIERKLEEKQKIDEEIKEADETLQNKNVNIQAINEHLALAERLKEHGLSTQDIDKFLNLLSNAKEYGFDPRLMVRKLRNIKRLENKENKLKASCEILSKQLTKYKEILPLAELVHSMNVSGRELVSFKVALNEAAEIYGLTPTSAALDVINLTKDHSKKGQLKRELSELSLQKYAIERFCSSRNQVITSLVKLQSHGITEDKIIHLNDFLESNGYNLDTKYSG
jgi:hypothetical protein